MGGRVAVAGGFFVLVAVVGLAVLTRLHRAGREAARHAAPPVREPAPAE
ncbi:hypothetical protein OOK44_29785 [Streptomyces cellulosae]|nr:hypothetical protein [Streptomyces cellulosae]WTC54093.1 hypothetical protein OH715_01795 [Streptomyces cellulosae]